jgi:predicted ATPase/DNA-binding CsgD family transcriptional regulator
VRFRWEIAILASPAHNLPLPLTSLIGREHELASVSRLLRGHMRLLTLVGPPGVGKTRLAVAAANMLRAEFAHGVSFVDLTPIPDASMVLPTIARALGLRPLADQPPARELVQFLASKRILLVLDNFEHVIRAALPITELLQATQYVKLLVTSRERLNASGEHLFPVPPLALPPVLADHGAPRTLAVLHPEQISAYHAVQLFVQRAAALQPDFALKPENALLVAGICCRLDGLPLALELAAARVRHISLQNIYDRLEKRLPILTGGAHDLPTRQRTLRTAIQWSYDLLESSERRLFVRLAVFRGGCSLEAVEAVCAKELPVGALDGLTSLVDKSLVQQKETAGGEARFSLLDMIREFAHEHLAASGELETIRHSHAAYYAELADRAEPELRLTNQKDWFYLLETEIANMRAALEWSLERGDVTAASRVISGTYLYWIVYGRQDEGIHWAQLLLARINDVAPEHHVRLLRSAVLLLAYRGREAARQLARRAVAAARADGDKRELGWCLWALSTTLPSDEEAEAVCQEAMVLLRDVADQPGLGLVYNSIGEHARLSGDHARARSAYERSLAIAKATGDARRQYYVWYNLAFVAQREGDHHEAIRALRRSLVLCQELGVPTDVVQELLALAGSLGALGEPLRAARLFGAAQAYLQSSGTLIDPSDQPEHDRNMALVRAQLGEAAFDAAWAAGQAMTFEQAVAYAQTAFEVNGLAGSPSQHTGEFHAASDLTRREREVALRVAEGKSNRAIAEELVITERTVEGHVSNILAKRGFRSRAQIAAWVAGRTDPDS